MISNNLTLITSIFLTGAITAGGTYYVTTHTQPRESNAGAEKYAEQPQPKLEPVSVAVNQPPSQPVEITIKTEVVEKHRGRRHDFRAEGIAVRNRPQPHYGVFQGQ